MTARSVGELALATLATYATCGTISRVDAINGAADAEAVTDALAAMTAERDALKADAERLAGALDEALAAAKAWANPTDDDVMIPPGEDEIFAWSSALAAHRAGGKS